MASQSLSFRNLDRGVSEGLGPVKQQSAKKAEKTLDAGEQGGVQIIGGAGDGALSDADMSGESDIEVREAELNLGGLYFPCEQ